MTTEERLQRIAKLRDDNERSRDRIAEREAERDRDPYAMQNFLMADARVAKDAGDLHFTEPLETPRGEPVEALYVRQTDSRGMLFRVGPENAAAPTAAAIWASQMGLDDGDALAQALAAIVVATKKELRAEFQRELAELRAENAELKSMLGDVLKRLETCGKAVSRLAADVVSERRDREALFGTLENRFSELRAFVRGTIRDWTSA
jgi:hypothetical protein